MSIKKMGIYSILLTKVFLVNCQEHKEMESLYEKALDGIMQKEGERYVYHSLGNNSDSINQLVSKATEAIVLFQKQEKDEALQVIENLDSTFVKQYPGLMSFINSNLAGYILSEKKEYKESKERFDLALEIFNALTLKKRAEYLKALLPLYKHEQDLYDLTQSADTLLKKAFALRRTNYPLSIFLAQTALYQGLSQNDQEAKAKAILQRGINYSILGLSEESLSELDTAISLFDELHLLNELGTAKLCKGIELSKIGDYKNAQLYLEEALAYFVSINDVENSSKALSGIGVNFARQGYYVEALEYFLESYQKKKENDFAFDAELSNIANVYRLMGAYDDALLYAHESLSHAEERQDSIAMYKSLNSLAGIHSFMKNQDSAGYYYQVCFELSKSIGHTPSLMTDVQNLSFFYREIGAYKEAIKIVKSYLHLFQESEKKSGIVNIYRSLGDSYYKLDFLDSSFYYLELSYTLAAKNKIRTRAKQAAEILSKNYELEGEFDKALLFARSAKAYDDTLHEENSDRKFANLRVQLATLESQKKIENLEKQEVINELSQNIFITLLCAGVLFFTLCFVFYEMRQQNKRKELERKLGLNNHRLTSHTLNMVHKNNGFSQIEEEVKQMRKTGEPNYQKILNVININRSVEKDWDNFNNYFGKVHPDFEIKLKSKFSNLVTSEIRLASLVRLNLTNAEIAAILYVESKSVRMSKYRLKKKLALTEEEDLFQFLSYV